MTYNLVFRIRREYYDQIVAGTKTREVRAYKEFWTVRAWAARKARAKFEPVIATFICGKDVHKRRVARVTAFADARTALGRSPSAQGLKDIGEGPVWTFDLGEAVA